MKILTFLIQNISINSHIRSYCKLIFLFPFSRLVKDEQCRETAIEKVKLAVNIGASFLCTISLVSVCVLLEVGKRDSHTTLFESTPDENEQQRGTRKEQSRAAGWRWQQIGPNPLFSFVRNVVSSTYASTSWMMHGLENVVASAAVASSNIFNLSHSFHFIFLLISSLSR